MISEPSVKVDNVVPDGTTQAEVSWTASLAARLTQVRDAHPDRGATFQHGCARQRRRSRDHRGTEFAAPGHPARCAWRRGEQFQAAPRNNLHTQVSATGLRQGRHTIATRRDPIATPPRYEGRRRMVAWMSDG